jgi:PAS domain S-box-containing protein
MPEKLKKRIEEIEAKYRRLFESARDGIIILDYHTGQINDVNPFLEQLLGYSKKELLNKKLWEVGAFKNMKLAQEYFKVLHEAGYIRYDNIPLEASDGRQIEVEFVSNVYKEDSGRVIQCNVRDISERRRSEVAMETQKLLEAEKSKTKFIADATHELRTPLAIIKGNVDLGLRATIKDSKAARAALKAIDTEVSHLSRLLSDLTDFTTKDSASYKDVANYREGEPIIFDKIDPFDILKNVVNRSKTLARKKDISVHLTAKKLPYIMTMGNKPYLEKLFVNLINNAITYGKKGGDISLSGSKNGNTIKILIVDNGIGIEEKDLPHIFDRFYRADSARTKNPEGTGLGLAISRWIVEAHGGTIDATSILGKGTTFTVSLPIRNKL